MFEISLLQCGTRGGHCVSILVVTVLTVRWLQCLKLCGVSIKYGCSHTIKSGVITGLKVGA